MRPRSANLAFTTSLAIALLLPLPASFVGTPTAAQTAITFPETGMTLSDAHGFLTYWQAHGGLAQFGYPLTPETVEVSPTDGRAYITQWFERNRFEYHPENADPNYQVLLGLLGHDLTKGRENEDRFRPVPNPDSPDCLYFPETGHTLCHSFLIYWQQNGGLALYGYPLSEELEETNPTDGKTYIVQYFERNRFEYHPENKGTPYEVLLGLLGAQIGGFPIPPLPPSNNRTTLHVPDRFKTDERWSVERTLTGPPGMQASLFGTAPLLRMMAIAPNGDIFASSTRTDQVLVMPDRDADGIADETITFAANLAKPHGLAFHDGYLYVACEAAVWRFPYAPGQLQANGDRQKIADVPYGPSQGLVQDVNHDTRSITFGPNNKMYVSVGSDCDLCADGNPDRATIFEFNDDGTNGRIYASGLRNAVGIDTDPRTGLLWASVNERNGSGSDIPPDLLTPIRSGGDYGWPYCLGIPLQPDPHFGMTGVFCAAKDTAPVALPAHSAPLGIRFYNGGGQLSKAFDYGIFLAMHGTAPRQGNNPPLREPAVGYDVSFVSLRPGKMAEGAQTVISGWLTNGEFWGRPVDLAFGHDGSMYISDDAGGAIYRLTFSVP